MRGSHACEEWTSFNGDIVCFEWGQAGEEWISFNGHVVCFGWGQPIAASWGVARRGGRQFG